MLDPQALSDAQTRYSQELVVRLEKRIRELENVNQSLNLLDKMKDTFIQLTAHELRTPLTLVYGYSRLIEDNFGTASPDAVRHQSAHADGRHVRRDCADADDCQRDSAGQPHHDQPDLTSRLARPTWATSPARSSRATPALQERKITVNFNKAEWPERMRADWELLELALRNLISNAIKFTPDGGTSTLNAAYDAEKVRFSIKDSGIGISKEMQKTLFERFHTNNDVQLHSTSKTAFRGGGIGLGLAVCKGIVEAHGGQIACYSDGYDPQRLPGSEFIVVMPLYRAPGDGQAVTQALSNYAARFRHKWRRVLAIRQDGTCRVARASVLCGCNAKLTSIE